jgi:hypothetical protein
MRPGSTPVDTDPALFRDQVQRWRSMTAFERAELADRLSVDVANIAVAGIRFDLPDAGPEAIRFELARRRYGTAVAAQAFGAAAGK